MQSEKDKGGVLPRVERYFTNFPLTIFSKKQKNNIKPHSRICGQPFSLFLEKKGWPQALGA
jgi:hypothetical protein